MPQIKEYNQQIAPVGPISARRDVNQGIGGSIEQLGSTISQAALALNKRNEQSEISDTNAKIAQVHAETTVGLKEALRTADPNDKLIHEICGDIFIVWVSSS